MRSPGLAGLLKSYMEGPDKKRTLETILAEPDAALRVYDMVFGEEQRAALRVLADACRKKRIRETIAPRVVRDIGRLLAIPDDKARKTACILAGVCAPDECAEALAEALRSERIRYVRPSIILALGNTKDPAKYLDGYVVEPGEEKHVRAEYDALKKALAGKANDTPRREPRNDTPKSFAFRGPRNDTPKSFAFRGPNNEAAGLHLPERCTLTSVKAAALCAELSDNGIAYAKDTALPGAFCVRTADIGGLRCYLNVLFHIGKIGAFKEAAERLDAMGCRGLNYRIEAGSLGQHRREAIQKVSEGFDACGYADNPSSYAFEIRLQNGGMYAVFPDERFAYRRETLPASIHPVAAASIVRLCRPYMKEDAAVLDPFCGSATLLIERGFFGGTSRLVGIDISPRAIKAACANRQASGLQIALIRGDCIMHGAARYDEVISNMPFGHRVSGHAENIGLYGALAGRLTAWLREGGMAFLFTQEKTLLRDIIGKNDKLSIVAETLFETGGLSPTLFIIRRH